MSNIIIGWDRSTPAQAGSTRFECPVATPEDGEHETCQWYIEVGPAKLPDLREVPADGVYRFDDSMARVESIGESHLDLCHPGQKEKLLAEANELYGSVPQRVVTGAGQRVKEILAGLHAHWDADLLDATPAELLQRTTAAAQEAARTVTAPRVGALDDRLSPAEMLSRQVKCCGYPRICGDACID